MSGFYVDQNMNGLLAALMKPTRRKVFVSYHHGGDQAYYDEFSRYFHDQYEAIRDNSLERLIQSDNTEYVMQQIRDKYITGTSCTIILIGAQSHQRKYLDWEIKATLDECHGLIGIVLPTHVKNPADEIVVPGGFLTTSRAGTRLGPGTATSGGPCSRGQGRKPRKHRGNGQKKIPTG
jgi:MTH538 TIR-like domain (DUF1863).